MAKVSTKLIGRGIYTIPEAARLTRVPRSRIRRWTAGYTYRQKGADYYSPPVVAARLEPINGDRIVDFGDLIEVRFLNSFRRHGVSMQAIRVAAEHARELLGRQHPFSSRIFKTDGQTILADIVTDVGDRLMLDLVKNQYAFEEVISPFLYEGLEFNRLDEPKRWRPLGSSARVLIDPQRSFGAPIVTEGVPTAILRASMNQEDDVEVVAAIYRIDVASVQDALQFESQIAA